MTALQRSRAHQYTHGFKTEFRILTSSVGDVDSRWSLVVSRVGEFVADPPRCEQINRLSGIGFDAPPQSLDERIDAANRDERVAAPYLREQRFAAEHDARMRCE